MRSKIATMINLSSRIPAAIKEPKFTECIRALSTLESAVYTTLHNNHKAILNLPSPVYYINFHARDIENGGGTINVALIKSQHHLLEIEIQYRIENSVPCFFEDDSSPINNWGLLVSRIVSGI